MTGSFADDWPYGIFAFLLTLVISKYNPSRSLTRQDWDSRSQYLKIWSGCLVNYLHRPCCQCDGTVFVGVETWECLEVWSGWHSGRVWGGRYLHFITVPAVSSCRVLSRILVDIRCSGEYWYATMVGIFTSWAPVITSAVMRITISWSDNQVF